MSTSTPCQCRQKETPRSAELQKAITRRLNRAIGQLSGVKTMIEENRYCGDVLMQLAAAEKAIRRVSEIVLREHLETCVADGIRRGDEEIIDEVMVLIRQFG